VSDDLNNRTVQLFEPVDGHQTPECDVDAANSLVHGSLLDPQMEVEATEGRSSEVCQTETTEASNAHVDSNGYVLVIDNLGMSVRHSFQRIDRSTESMHFCHAYAVLNRFDASGLEDGPPSGVLSCEDILPDMNDLQQLWMISECLYQGRQYDVLYTHKLPTLQQNACQTS